MRLISMLAFAFAAMAAAKATLAEPLNIATARQGSSTYSIGLAIGKAAAEISALDVRPLPFQSTSQASPMVNTGEIAFGLENAVAIQQAITGTGSFEGFAQKDLRLVARLQPLRMTLGVRADSDIHGVADLKGKRLPAQFGTTVTGEMLISAMLATGGLTYDDVQRVPVASFTAMADAFANGDLDAYIFVLGSPRDMKVSTQVGGLRPLDLPDDPEAMARVKAVLPVMRSYELTPDLGIQDVTEPTTVMQYDYFVYTNANVPDAQVAALLKALKNGKAMMQEMVASLVWFDPEAVYVDVGLPYHPAALAFFEANGITPR